MTARNLNMPRLLMFVLVSLVLVSMFVLTTRSSDTTSEQMDGFTPFENIPTFDADQCVSLWPPPGAEMKDQTYKNEFPKLVHQVWSDDDPPLQWYPTRKTCMDMYQKQGYTYKLWSFSDVEKLIATDYHWFLPTWHSYPYIVERADASKYFLLYHYGGIYMDLDVECVGDFDPVLRNVSQGAHTVARYTDPSGIAADTLMAKPRNPFFLHTISNLPAANGWYGVPYATIMFSTGPMYLGHSYNSYPCKEQIDTVPVSYLTETYFVHHHASSWHGWDGHIITFFYTRGRMWLTLLCCTLIGALCLAIYYRYKRLMNVSSLSINSCDIVTESKKPLMETV